MRRSTTLMWPLFLAGTVIVVGACSDDDDGSSNNANAAVDAGQDAGSDAGSDAGLNNNNYVVEWVSCARDVNEPEGAMVECAMIEVPLRHAEPDGPTIDLWVQRVEATVNPKRGQIWFLQGGPGESGASLAWIMERVGDQAPQWDLITTDHRGVGNSARLECPVQEAAGSDGGFDITEAERPACLQHVQNTWGADLAEFNVTAAAADIGLLVDRIREPDRDVFLYGVSYGTYWLLRYLHLYPNQADGIILDSIAPPGFNYAQYDSFMNDIGEDLMGYCATDTSCVSRLGSDPWVTTGQIFDDLANGSCPGYSALLDVGTERSTLRWALAYLFRVEVYRELVPAILHRLNRCAPADVVSIEHLLTALFLLRDSFSNSDALGSEALRDNIAVSELTPAPSPNAATLEALQDTLYFSLGVSHRNAVAQEIWPVYPADQYVGAWPTTDIPILMGNGDLDPQTPPWVAQPAQAHFTGTHQYFYELPRCSHALVVQSPVTTPGAPHCFLQMLVDFVDDPTTAPASACISDIKPVSFEGAHPYSQYFLGENDMWENGMAPPPPPLMPQPMPHIIATPGQ